MTRILNWHPLHIGYESESISDAEMKRKHPIHRKGNGNVTDTDVNWSISEIGNISKTRMRQ